MQYRNGGYTDLLLPMAGKTLNPQSFQVLYFVIFCGE
jgi:hypothetical protein